MIDEGHPLHHLLDMRNGRSRQVSSAGRDPHRGGTWWGLRPEPARRKRVLLEPGETLVLASLAGSGIINRLWMTTFLPLNRRALRDLVLRFYWDNENDPSVECPVGDFFGAPFGCYVSYVAEPMSITAGGFNAIWPMPYASGARLQVTNEGESVIDPFFYQIGYRELPRRLARRLRFHAQWRREALTRPGVPYTVLEASGTGHYVGCHLAMQNRTWWLRPPLARMIFPYAFGMGMLEGQEHTWIDSEEAPVRIGTGTEDFFNSAWYFTGGPFSAPYHGCTIRNYVTGRVSAYRFETHAVVPFRRSIRLTIDHGFENQSVTDYTSVAYWYQIEPHRRFPPLPDAKTRRPASVLANVFQAALAIVIPVLAVGSIFWPRKSRRAAGDDEHG